MMRRRFVLGSLLGVLMLMARGVLATQSPAVVLPKTLAISQIVEHPALDATRLGLLEALAHAGYVEGKNLKVLYKNAQGNITTSAQIAQTFVAITPPPSVFVAIGTPSAQGAMAATKGKNIPVVFTAVTDPVSSRLVKDLNGQSAAITGIIDYPPLKVQMEMMLKAVPALKVLGVMYNAGESNSTSVIEDLKKIAAAQAIEIVEGVVSKAADLPLAFRHLQSRHVQAIYVPQDNTVIAAMPQLAALSYAAKIPVFTSDNGSVKEGAVASVSYSYRGLGLKTGDYVVLLLRGESAATLPIASPDHFDLYVNHQAAQRAGVVLDQDYFKNFIDENDQERGQSKTTPAPKRNTQ